jgi:hypothetical protein
MSEWNNWAPTGRISVKFDVSDFSKKKTVEEIQVSLKPDKNNRYGTLHEDKYTFLSHLPHFFE